MPYGVSQKHSIVYLDSQNTSIQRALGVLWDTEILQTHHVYSMLKRRGNERFHVVSTWNTGWLIFDNSIQFDFLILAIQLWQRKIDWGDPLQVDQEIRWKNCLINLSNINQISLPRWYGFSFVETSCMELHMGQGIQEWTK